MKSIIAGVVLAGLISVSPASAQSRLQSEYNWAQRAPRGAVLYPDWEWRPRVKDGKAYVPYLVPLRGYPILGGGRVFDLQWRRVK
jgi:hypothetical protein